jgi:hypothetical protein
MGRARLLLGAAAISAAASAVAACSSSGSASKPTAAATPSTGASVSVPAASSAIPVAGSASTSAAGASSLAAAVVTESNPPGDIPDSTAFVPYQPSGATFAVSVPEGWARQAAGSGVSFSDKLNSISITWASATSAVTVDSAKKLIVPQLQSSARAFKLVDVTQVQRKAGAAVLVRYGADSAPNSVTNKVIRDDVQLYVFFRSGVEVDLTLSGPVNADNVDPWKTVTDSLQWK